MKKNLIALGAVAMLAGVAHADVVVNPATSSSGATLQRQDSGIGHILTVPYFSTQGANATTLNITNTDTVNGKAVKVRFRGARNSDDVFDFTLYLSPGDVWSGTVSVDADTGLSKIASGDTSITVPRNSQLYGPLSLFGTERVLGNDPAETREGYIEILNTADIPATRWNVGGPTTFPNALWQAVKHGVEGQSPDANGSSSAAQSLVEGHHNAANNITTWAAATSAGYAFPTGGIFANWLILNVENASVNSGEAVALSPETTSGAIVAGNFTLFPQSKTVYNNSAFTSREAAVSAVTADPLLRVATVANQGFAAQFFDFPDLSTPYVGVLSSASVGTAPVAPTTFPDPTAYGYVATSAAVNLTLTANVNGQPRTFSFGAFVNGTPAALQTALDAYATALGNYEIALAAYNTQLAAQANAWNSNVQANEVSSQFAVSSLINEYAYNGDVDLKTEWLFSSPTRRYAVAVDYANDAIVENSTSIYWQAPPASDANVELIDGTIVVVDTITGIDLRNREEVLNDAPVVSPFPTGADYVLPGEVSTLKFNRSGDVNEFSVLGASIATQVLDLNAGAGVGNVQFNEGWAKINFANPVNGSGGLLPVYGFSTYSANGGFSVGVTWNHRYTR